MHRHHPVAKSRGGDDSYTVNVDPYQHCYDHAIDFLLFDSAPRFDFRHEAWPLLPNDLREKVLERAQEIGKVRNHLTPEGRVKGGKNQGSKCARDKVGVCGRSSEKMTEDGRKGGEKGGKTQGKRNADNRTGFCNPEVQSANGRKLNSIRVRCKVTGHISTPGGLSRYQQGRNIDHTNPENREVI